MMAPGPTIARVAASLGNLRKAYTSQRLPDPPPKKRLRIGIFTDSYSPVVNGVTTSVITLIEQLERLGHSIHIFAPKFPGYTDDPPNVTRFPSVLTPLDPGYPLPVPFSHHLISAVARYNLDVIHSQSPFMLGLVALMVARAESIPLVATNHTLYTEYSHYVPVVPEELTKNVTRSVVHWYYERCDAVIAPSRMAADRLRDGYGIRKAVVKIIPTGIPIPPEISADDKIRIRQRYGVKDGEILLLFAGRVAKEKNLAMLLDSFEHEVYPKHPEAHLILAGSGPDADAIRHRIESSKVLRTNARLTGFLKRDELDPLYAAADLFTFPSVSETQGVVLGEALAAGTACVGCDEAGSPETVTNGVNGILTPNDQRLFAAAVNGLIENPKRREEMSIAARMLAQERTPEKMVEQVLAVYRIAQRRVTMRRRSFMLKVARFRPHL